MSKNNLRSIAVLSYAIIICLSGLITFNGYVNELPIVIQNMMAILGGVIFGPLQGSATTGIFLTMGALGLPVFAGFRGGMLELSGLSGGYLIGYFIGALVTGFYIGQPIKDKKDSLTKIIIGVLLGFAIIHITGAIQFIRFRNIQLSLKSLQAALNVCVLPYIPFDIIKAIFTVLIGIKLRPLSAKYLSDI